MEGNTGYSLCTISSDIKMRSKKDVFGILVALLVLFTLTQGSVASAATGFNGQTYNIAPDIDWNDVTWNLQVGYANATTVNTGMTFEYVFSSCSILGLESHSVFGVGCGLAASKKQAQTSPFHRSLCPYRS